MDVIGICEAYTILHRPKGGEHTCREISRENLMRRARCELGLVGLPFLSLNELRERVKLDARSFLYVSSLVIILSRKLIRMHRSDYAAAP